MKREWKPGDVALVTHKTGEHRAIRVPYQSWSLETGWADCLPDDLVDAARPLVVIDPEAREQVERLAELIDEHDRGGKSEQWIADLAVALREFADPEPEIEEPTKDGTLVACRYGDMHGRAVLLGGSWMFYGDHFRDCSAAFGDFDDVEVLSEGVTA